MAVGAYFGSVREESTPQAQHYASDTTQQYPASRAKDEVPPGSLIRRRPSLWIVAKGALAAVQIQPGNGRWYLLPLLKFIQVMNTIITNTNTLNLTLIDSLNESLPGAYAALFTAVWGVD